MKKVLMLLLFMINLGPATAAIAADTDFHVGSYEGTWCNYKAKFDVETREGDTWVFRGKILIRSTGQYDPLWIEQYDDQSLRIIRYLQGSRLGQTQVVQTYPPQSQLVSNQIYHVFRSQQGYGYGCDGTSSSLSMWQQ